MTKNINLVDLDDIEKVKEVLKQCNEILESSDSFYPFSEFYDIQVQQNTCLNLLLYNITLQPNLLKKKLF